jgi:hypothetical protein
MRKIRRKEIQQETSKIHYRSNGIRSSDKSNFLCIIRKNQIEKNINPPPFDFDASINTGKIIDSTLYFFLRNCDKNEVLEAISPPSDELERLATQRGANSTQ